MSQREEDQSTSSSRNWFKSYLSLLFIASCLGWNVILVISQILILHDQKTKTQPGDSSHVPAELDERGAKAQETLSLTALTKNPVHLECPHPLVPIYDKIVQGEPFAIPRKIPRIIHVSMKSRCIPTDLADAVQRWETALPHHSLYFHDDDAVDRLLQQKWPEFPHLSKVATNCLRFGGAVKIDVWRVLILYQFGGVYTDIDNWPGILMDEVNTIQANDTAFFVSDAWDRPSQWFQAMEPRHPIAYFTLFEILKRVYELNKVSELKPVFVTGPDALKHGYGHFFAGADGNWQDGIFGEGVFVGKFHKAVRKIKSKNTWNYVESGLGRTFDDIVAWNNSETGTLVNITRREKIERESGVIHWNKDLLRKKRSMPNASCKDILYSMDAAMQL